jgi:hypothetical protein
VSSRQKFLLLGLAVLFTGSELWEARRASNEYAWVKKGGEWVKNPRATSLFGVGADFLRVFQEGKCKKQRAFNFQNRRALRDSI